MSLVKIIIDSIVKRLMSAPQQPNSVQYTHTLTHSLTHTTCVSAAHSATNRRPHTAHVSLLIGRVLFSPRDLESDWSRRLSVTVAPPPRFVWKGCWFFRSLVAAVGWSRCARAGAFLLIYFSSFDSIPPTKFCNRASRATHGRPLLPSTVPSPGPESE